MSTKIEWCEETWNPIVGCTKVSPGCDHCYAERMAFRLGEIYANTLNPGLKKYYQVIVHKKENFGKWTGKTYFEPDDINKPLKWKKPRKVFVCSMGDLFHENVYFEQIVDVWEVMIKAPQHTYLILTKRPQRALEFTKWLSKETAPVGGEFFPVLPHIWWGVTAENQMRANERIPILLQIPAAKRFVSVEPMLTAIDFYDIQMGNEFYNSVRGFGDISASNGHFDGRKLDWVICGGESGPGARPLYPDWVRSLRDQCEAAGTPFFFKQWGEYIDLKQMESLSPEMEGIRYTKTVPYTDGSGPAFRVGKKAAGSELDGEYYKQYPKH